MLLCHDSVHGDHGDNHSLTNKFYRWYDIWVRIRNLVFKLSNKTDWNKIESFIIRINKKYEKPYYFMGHPMFRIMNRRLLDLGHSLSIKEIIFTEYRTVSNRIVRFTSTWLARDIDEFKLQVNFKLVILIMNFKW